MSDVVIDAEKQREPLLPTSDELERMLLCMQNEIVPITREGVANGNKVFGAAILKSEDLSTVCISTNNELECPLLHGEMNLIYNWSKQVPASERGDTAQNACVFLSTHEPCCMCISGILWSGFTKVYYFFPYSSTASQGIPYDINTMHELWGVSTYRKQNKYLSTACIMELVEGLDDADEKKASLLLIQQQLIEEYDKLSNQYHTEKLTNANNNLVLG